MVVPSRQNRLTPSRSTNWNCTAQYKKKTNILIQLNNRIPKYILVQHSAESMTTHKRWILVDLCVCRWLFIAVDFKHSKFIQRWKLLKLPTVCIEKKIIRQTDTNTNTSFVQTTCKHPLRWILAFFLFDDILLFLLVDTVVFVVVVIARFCLDHFRGHKYRVKLKKQLTILLLHYLIFSHINESHKSF